MQANQIAQDLYVVERIIGKKVMGKKVLYKVKWQGYPESESTWEKVSHLRYVSDLVDSYESQRGKGIEKNAVNELLAMGTGSDSSQSSDTAEKEATIDKDPIADPRVSESKVTSDSNSSSLDDDDKQKCPNQQRKKKGKLLIKNITSIQEKSQNEEESSKKHQEEEMEKKERNRKKEQKRLKIFRKMKERQAKTIDYPSYCPQEERDSSEEEQNAAMLANPMPDKRIKDEQQAEREEVGLKICLMESESNSDIREYVVIYKNGNSKVFNTWQMFYAHPVEFVGYLEKKAHRK